MKKAARKSIAVVTYDFVNGGSVGAVAWNQAKEIAKSYTVYAVAKNFPSTLPKHVYQIPVYPRNWKILRCFAHVPNDLSFQHAAYKALLNLTRKVDLHTIWCHSHATVVLCSDRIARKQGCILVLTTHGDIFDRPAGTYDPLLTAYYKSVTNRAYESTDIIQALSPYMCKLIARRVTDDSKIVLIPNGVRIQEIGLEKIVYRSSTDFSVDNKLNLLFVGNLLPVKGVHHLLRALAKLNLNRQQVNLTCVGDGPELPALKKLTAQLKLDDTVTYVGRLDRTQLGNYFINADLLCAPSDNDPLPTVILEAFAAGLPVIGSNTGGITSMLGEGRGLLFEPGDVDGLAAHLEKVAQDNSILLPMSAACSKSVETKYTWEAVGEKLRLLL